MDQIKKCTKCFEEKHINEFYGKKQIISRCKSCHNKCVMSKRQENLIKYKEYLKETWNQPYMIYARKKANAKSENIEIPITKNEFIQWYNSQEIACHYCGLKPEDFKLTEDPQLFKKINLGLDRMNNNLGYLLDNIVLCCNRCNTIKTSFFSYEEMKLVAKVINKKWKQKGIKINKLRIKIFNLELNNLNTIKD